MTTDKITRVRYFEHQFLRTKDFETEQAYHIDMRRRHNIAQHYWGIVQGLELGVDADGLFVQAGMAVDGYGRELVLAMRRALSTDEFSAKARDDLDVWLVYARRGSDRAPQGYNSCDERARAQYYRWQEEPQLRISKPEPGGTRARAPALVPREVLNGFAPHQMTADDPQQQWPVYLGRILRDNTDPENPIYSVDLSDRPYAGLVGEAILAPSGRAKVRMGNEVRLNPTGDANQPLVESSRFSVELSEDECTQREALRIDGDGRITVKGRANVQGDVQIEDGSIEFKVGVGTAASSCYASPGGGAPTPARPWRIYRYKCSHAAVEQEQLRIEMSPTLGEAGQVVIGAWSADDETFKPVLTVSNDNRVIVHGDLIVEGQSIGLEATSGPSAARKMTPEAENFLLGSYASGIGGANLQIGKFYHSPFGEAVDLNTPEGIKNAIDYISADGTRLGALIDILFDNPVVAQDFIVKMMGEDSGRRQVLDQLVVNPSAQNGFAGLLRENVYNDVLAPFAQNMVATQDGREAIMSSLVSASNELQTFADLLTDPRFRDRADEFALGVSKSDEGRKGFMTGLSGGSTELTEFADLLTKNTYFDRLSVFAEKMMATEQGQREILQSGIPLNSQRLMDFADLLRDAFPDWTNQILDRIKSISAGADLIAANLLFTVAGRSAALRDLLLEFSRLQDFVNRLLNEQDGRRASAESLEGNSAGDAGATARRQAFVNLDWLALAANATPTDWKDHYERLQLALCPAACPPPP